MSEHAPPVLFADRGCPFAHRVRALLDHLTVVHDVVESPPGERPLGSAGGLRVVVCPFSYMATCRSANRA